MTHPTPTPADKEQANTLVFRRVLSGEYESVYSIPPDIWEQDIAAALATAREQGREEGHASQAAFDTAALNTDLLAQAKGGIIDCTGAVPVVWCRCGELDDRPPPEMPDTRQPDVPADMHDRMCSEYAALIAALELDLAAAREACEVLASKCVEWEDYEGKATEYACDPPEFDPTNPIARAAIEKARGK